MSTASRSGFTPTLRPRRAEQDSVGRADGCDPVAGCKRRIFRVLMCASAVASPDETLGPLLHAPAHLPLVMGRGKKGVVRAKVIE